MAPLVTKPSYTFINVTDDPVEGRHERRAFVRRTVMTDYHKRRKQPTHSRDAIPGKEATELSPKGPRIGSDQLESSRPAESKVAAVDSSSAGVALSLVPLESRSSHLFQPKHWSDPHLGHISGLVMQFLVGQTTKAVRDMSYVAFIHRNYQYALTEEDADNSFLENCGKLLRLFINRDASLSDAEFWSMLHREQERIYSQIETLNKWKLLSAAQAMVLYLLLWLKAESGRSNFVHGHLAMMFTLGKMFFFLKGRHLHIDPSCSFLRPVHDWHEWIFQESCLRLATVYFVLGLVVDTDIGFSCDGPADWCLEMMPLPATKASWEANSETAWLDAIDGFPDLTRKPTFGSLFGTENGPHPADDSWGEALDEMGLIFAMAGELYPGTKGPRQRNA